MAAAGLLIMVAGCRRTPDGLPLASPDDDVRLGTVSATWRATEDERL